MDLNKKIEKTYHYFNELLKDKRIDKVYISWTGGKDSTTLLHLWINFLKRSKIDSVPRVLSIDTGFIFKEIKKFMDEFKGMYPMELKIITPQVNLEEYPKKDVITCCNDLKIKPLKRAISEFNIELLLTGVRRDESVFRKDISFKEQKEDPFYIQGNPIIHWTEMDIWAYHMQENLPYCTLYNQGYRSIDCIPCTKKAQDGERTGRNQEKEQKLSLLHSLGYF